MSAYLPASFTAHGFVWELQEGGYYTNELASRALFDGYMISKTSRGWWMVSGSHHSGPFPTPMDAACSDRPLTSESVEPPHIRYKDWK